MARRADGSYEFGDYDGFNPVFHARQAAERATSQQREQAAAQQRRSAEITRQQQQAASFAQPLRPAPRTQAYAAPPVTQAAPYRSASPTYSGGRIVSKPTAPAAGSPAAPAPATAGKAPTRRGRGLMGRVIGHLLTDPL